MRDSLDLQAETPGRVLVSVSVAVLDCCRFDHTTSHRSTNDGDMFSQKPGRKSTGTVHAELS